MKRKIFILVALFMLFGITATAENVGDVIGAVYPTDIIPDICGYEIPAYNIGGETAVLFKDELAPESCIPCRDKERLRV